METELKVRVGDHTILYYLGIFFITWTIYWLSTVLFGHFQSPPFDYFDKLADAFLHRRLYLIDPPIVHDLTFYNERWYVPFPPLPALLMLPWIWLFGSINTTGFLVVVGAINVTLVFVILQDMRKLEWTHLKTVDNLWLAAFFGFGTAHWYLSTIGAVWFTSQICTVTFMLLTAWFGITHRSPLWASFALSLAMLARPHVVLAYPFLLTNMIARCYRCGREVEPYTLIKGILVSLFPIAISLGLLLIYNTLRFDDMWDFGYRTENVYPALAEELHTYGQFSLHYVTRNLYVMLSALPMWSANRDFIVPNPEGMSLMVTSPALIFLYRARPTSIVTLGAWLATALLLIPLMLYYNTGRDQFGYRFSMDFIVPVMILLALGQKNDVSRVMRILVMVSIGVNMWGVLWFHHLIDNVFK
jgi:hypothetical protein